MVRSFVENGSFHLWSSIATDGYLALTAHYVDKNWILQKKILSFHHMPPPHSGPILAEKVIHLLKEWGIEKKVFSLTLDNAKYNDGLIDVLKRHLSLTDTLFCSGEFFHVRCGAHILNLIVQAGLKVIDEAVNKIRESVKYVRGSEGRKIKFAECIAQLSLSCSKKVCQDVPTRWNYTYLMIDGALMYRRAFDQLQLIDVHFKTCPSDDEWVKVENIAKFLKPFYDITTLFSGSHYPTANLYFHGVWKIQMLIKEEMKNSCDAISSMAKQMKEKFDKYWECYSVVLSFAIILDPRYKLQFVEFCFKKLYPATYVDRVKFIRDKLYMLFEEYMCLSSVSTSNQSSVACASGGDNIGDEMDEFDIYESQHYGLTRNKSQLDLFLEEQKFDRKQDLDILSYWKANKLRYPELALMARDILSIPITTVASESAFSIGSQILNKYRSSIVPKNAEALLCTRDWLYEKGNIKFSNEDEEDEELAEDFESIITTLKNSSNDSHSSFS
ncbi:hypothetical protein F0562_027982 [Nyssa sinensis]|uniref:HAT C-terminal dimerisation domain-containing protein n=1 Tax=Nyssa sinensis TaxID=561372 RepID=A0A5J5B960_9ASTE|nr:hypothetical protein F0562_027982 [Nyssa sinensis]